MKWELGVKELILSSAYFTVDVGVGVGVVYSKLKILLFNPLLMSEIQI